MTAKAVAWRWTRKDIPDDWQVGIGHPQLPEASFLIEPLYASPPPVQPVVKALDPKALRAMIDEMRAGLEGVTPGLWVCEGNGGHIVSDTLRKTIMKAWNANPADPPHIARCSPENIAKLLDAAEATLTAPPSPAPGVTDEMVDAAVKAYNVGGVALANREQMRTALLAALQPAEQPDAKRKELLDRCWRLNTRAEAAEARVKALEEGLEPFAKLEIGPIDFRDGYVKRVPNEWLSRARALLDKPGGE